MWRRNTDDPLMRMFLDRYHLHLLYVPREGVAVGDLYVYDGRRVSSPGKVTYFLEPPLEMPPITIGEHMADVSGIVSHGVSTQWGLGYLENFLSSLGAGGIVNRVRAGYEAKKANVLKFRFAHATRDSVDVMLLGVKLIRRKLMEDHPLHEKGNQYYLVTAVARTPSISIMSESDKEKALTLNVGAMKLAEVATGVSLEESSEGEVTFNGEKSLAFGVELHELVHDSKHNKLRLKMPQRAIKLRRKVGKPPERRVKPAFIGGSDDDVFFTVEYA